MTIKETLLATDPPNESCTMDTVVPLMSWSIRTVDQTPIIRQTFILMGLFPAFAYAFAAFWALHDGNHMLYEARASFIPGALLTGLIVIVISRQKTVFNYQVFANHGTFEFYNHYPLYAGNLFKALIILIALLLTRLGIYTIAWALFIFIPMLILAGTGGKLLSWKPPVTQHISSPFWKEHKFVTVDRKYRIVVTHRDDPTLGFIAHFPDKKLMEQYLDFLRTVLPPDVQYKEEIWKW